MKISIETYKAIDSLDVLVKAQSKAVSRALKDSASDLARQIRNNLGLNHTRGRLYERGGVKHYASRRGAFPNSDTGFLKSSVQPSRSSRQGEVFVVVGARYAKSLEYGRRRMAARPFVRPTIEQTKRRMRLRVLKALSSVR